MSKRILGIDPSLRGTGFAVIEVSGNVMRLIGSCTLRLKERISFVECLRQIAECAERWARGVDECAYEGTVFVQNYKTMGTLGASKGAALVGAMHGGIKYFYEYAPKEIKKWTSFNGSSEKEAVAAAVKSMLGLNEALPFDESDAAGAAICHALKTGNADSNLSLIAKSTLKRTKSGHKTSVRKSWTDYINRRSLSI